jgi:hypothetical protein
VGLIPSWIKKITAGSRLWWLTHTPPERQAIITKRTAASRARWAALSAGERTAILDHVQRHR